MVAPPFELNDFETRDVIYFILVIQCCCTQIYAYVESYTISWLEIDSMRMKIENVFLVFHVTGRRSGKDPIDAQVKP